MAKTVISQVTPLDAWLLRRMIVGYTPNPQQLKHATPVVAHMLAFLGEITPQHREQAVQMNMLPAAFERVKQVDPESAAPGEERQWTIIHADELANLPPLVWLIDKEIPERGLTVLFGESGAGKSFVALDYALRIAQDHPVLYIPTEGEAGYYKRVWAWCQHHKQGRGQLHFLFGAMSLLDKEMLALLLDDVLPIAPKLIVVDTLAMAMAGGDENSQRDMGIVIKACRTISFNIKAAVLLVHHVGKSGVSERGSSALRGNADTMIRVNPADDLILIECSKTKDEQPFEPRYMKLLPVSVDAVGGSLVPIPAKQIIHQKGDPLTPGQRKILEFLALEVNSDGATVREVADSTGISLGTIMRTLSNLMRYGYVHKPFGSYCLHEDGKKILTSDPRDPHLIHEDGTNLADDPLDPLDPHDPLEFLKTKAGSTGSNGSSLKTVDQGRINRGSSGLRGSAVKDFTTGNVATDEETQEALFDTTQATPRSNQYEWERKAGR